MGGIDIKKLSLDELVGVVNIYPWFGVARKELCRRMSHLGDRWDINQYADAALYICERDLLSDVMRAANKETYSDADAETLIKDYTETPVYVVGGDYFSQSDYEHVRKSDDNVFSRYAMKARQDIPVQEYESKDDFDLYTETLAQIYAEQGYYDKAKEIYSKLILAYPEKSIYFAALIRKLTENINN